MLPPLVCPHCHAFTQGRMACPNPNCAKVVASGIDGSQPRRVLAEVGGPINGRPVVLYDPSDAARSPWIAVGYAGVEDRSGGVAVIDFLGGALHQRVDVHAGVTNLTALPGHRLAFGDAAGRFHVLDLVRGALISSDTALEGSVVAAPVVLDDAAAILVSQQGEIAEVDLRSARIVRVTRVPPEQGGTVRIVAEPVVSRHHGILVSIIDNRRRHGRLLTFDRSHGHLETLCRFDAALYSTPILVDHRSALLALAGFKGDPSGIAVVDLQRRVIAPDFYPTEDYIRARPSEVKGAIYFGDYSHRLHAVETGTLRSLWKHPLQWHQSIVCSPLVLPDHNLVLFADTRGHVVAIDARAAAASAEGDAADSLIWSIELPKTTNSGSDQPAIVPGGFVRLEEQVCFGTMGGQVIAMPYYHDRADWAMQEALGKRQPRQPRRAATYAILAAREKMAETPPAAREKAIETPPAAREKAIEIPLAAREKAAEILCDGGCFDLAGAIYESIPQFTEAADAYRKARLWKRAIPIYEQLGELTDLRECLEAQAETEGLPFLNSQIIGFTPLKVNEASKVTLRINNILVHRARRLILRFAGPFGAIAEKRRPELLQGRPWEVTVDVVPREAGAVSIAMTVEVDGPQGRSVRSQELSHVLQVSPVDQAPTIFNVDHYNEHVARYTAVSAGGDQGLVSITEHHHHPVASESAAADGSESGRAASPRNPAADIRAGRSIGVVKVKGHDDVHIDAGEDIGMAEVD